MRRLWIVTGASGHLGNVLVRTLVDHGEWVRCLALTSESTQSLDMLPVDILRGNVCDIKSLEPLFSAPDSTEIMVVHAAGIVSIASGHQKLVHEVNVGGTANIIKMCLRCKVKRLVHISSVHAIPERAPGEIISEVSAFSAQQVKGVYAKSKAEATQLVLESVRSGLDAVVVQPSGIVGPGDFGRGHMTQLFLDYLEGRFRAIINGGYDFVDVRDVAAGILAAAEKGFCGECYILSNRYVSVAEFIQILSDVSGKPPIRRIIPLVFAKMTAPLSEIYYLLRRQPPLYTPCSLAILQCNARFSHEKASKILGYQPRDFHETVLDTFEWLVKNGKVPKYAPPKVSG